jgi:hypothetical protein
VAAALGAGAVTGRAGREAGFVAAFFGAVGLARGRRVFFAAGRFAAAFRAGARRADADFFEDLLTLRREAARARAVGLRRVEGREERPRRAGAARRFGAFRAAMAHTPGAGLTFSP